MIAKKIIGRGFRGALDYDLTKEGCRLLHTNLVSTAPRGMAKEFGVIRKLRPGLKKAVLHVSIAAAPGEKLSDNQWIDVAEKYLKGMGLNKSQFVITRHSDTEHEHIHIVANRIKFDGTVVSDSKDYERQEKVMRELERDYSLTPVIASREVKLSRVKQAEIEKALRLGEQPPRLVLQELVAAATVGQPSTSEFMRRLEVDGVGVIANIASTGRMNGFSFEFAGVAFSGSKLGEKYKWSELQKVIDYEQARDRQELTARNDAARNNRDALQPGRIDVNDLDANPAGSADGAAVNAPAAGDRDDRSIEQQDLAAAVGGGRRADSSDPVRPGAGDSDTVDLDDNRRVDRGEVESDRERIAASGDRRNKEVTVREIPQRGSQQALGGRYVEPTRHTDKPETIANNQESSNDRRNRTADYHRNAHPAVSQRDVERIRNDSPSKTIHSVRSMHERSVDRDPRDANRVLKNPAALSTGRRE